MSSYTSTVLTQLVSPGFRAGVYAGNAAWHSMAFVNFAFRPRFMIEKLTTRKQAVETLSTPAGDGWHQDILRYLGAINLGYATLALLRFAPLVYTVQARLRGKGPGLATTTGPNERQLDVALDVVSLGVLGIANLSQAFCNFFVARPSGRWIVGSWRGLKTDRITVLDTLFSVLDFAVVGARLLGY